MYSAVTVLNTLNAVLRSRLTNSWQNGRWTKMTVNDMHTAICHLYDMCSDGEGCPLKYCTPSGIYTDEEKDRIIAAYNKLFGAISLSDKEILSVFSEWSEKFLLIYIIYIIYKELITLCVITEEYKWTLYRWLITLWVISPLWVITYRQVITLYSVYSVLWWLLYGWLIL